MKKFFKWLAIPACLLFVSSVALGQSLSQDTSKATSYYHTYGYSAGAFVKEAIDKSTMPESLIEHIFNTSSAQGQQLARRVATIPLSSGAVVDTVTDSLWTQLLVVPPSRTVMLKTVSISARVEADINGAAKFCRMHFLWYDASGTTLDTFATKIEIDKDSAAYDNVALAVTRLDSSFAAGDILWAMIFNDTTLTVSPEGLGITLEYELAE